MQGVYKFQLKVTDNNSATGLDTIQVTVNAANIPPTANAGIDQSITLPLSSVTLSGSGTDPDGTISAYSWTKISGPASGTITNAAIASTTVTALVQGVYQFQLKVTDNNSGNGFRHYTSHCQCCQHSTDGKCRYRSINNITTQQCYTPGSGTDPDGTISAYSWTKISGPAAGTITNASHRFNNRNIIGAGSI